MVVSRRLLDATGAVGRLHHAGRKAALPHRRRLLVAGHAQNADRPAEQLGQRRSEIAGAIAHRRQQGGGHAEQVAEIRVPAPVADIEQQGARRIGGVGGVHLAAGEPPQQKAVDRSEGEPPGARRLARARHVVEQPGNFRSREIRIEQQPGGCRDRGLVAGLAQRRAGVRGAPVLPDDGVVDRPAGRPVPDDRRLALIGDPDRRDVLRAGPRFRHGGAHGRERARPDLLRIVLDQARRRIVLGEFLLGGGDRRQGRVEQDRARRGGALVDGEEVVRQAGPHARLWRADRAQAPTINSRISRKRATGRPRRARADCSRRPPACSSPACAARARNSRHA